MINKAFFEQAQELAEARGISVEDVYEIFKKSLVNSFKKIYGNTSCKVVINPDKNEINLYSVHVVASLVEILLVILLNILQLQREQNIN